MAWPISIKKVLPNTMKEFGLEEKAGKYTIITGWPEVVGEKVASVTIPEKLDRGTLTVRVMNTVWKYELTMRKAEILAKLQNKFGERAVQDIHWK